MSAHLTSKAHKESQAKEMFKQMKEVKDKYPKLHIIMGIDANHSLISHPENSYFTLPTLDDKTTSSKKRTSMQVQFHKANVEVFEVKDHLISTMPFQETSNFLSRRVSVIMVNGSDKVDNIYLPNPHHPYDHFIVAGLVW